MITPCDRLTEYFRQIDRWRALNGLEPLGGCLCGSREKCKKGYRSGVRGWMSFSAAWLLCIVAVAVLAATFFLSVSR